MIKALEDQGKQHAQACAKGLGNAPTHRVVLVKLEKASHTAAQEKFYVKHYGFVRLIECAREWSYYLAEVLVRDHWLTGDRKINRVCDEAFRVCVMMKPLGEGKIVPFANGYLGDAEPRE